MPYCPSCGREVSEDAQFCSNCGYALKGQQPEVGVETRRIDLPYPDSPSVNLSIIMSAPGNVKIGKGAGEKLVEGTVEFNVPEWAPEVQTQGDNVRLLQRDGWRIVPRALNNPVNKWDLHLGDKKPLNVKVSAGVSSGEYNLGGLPLRNLDLEMGVGKNVISFDGANPEEMDRLGVSAGAGEVEMRDLLNSNFKQMRVRGGVGELRLSFMGERLKKDAAVDMEGGVGSFVVVVDEGVPAHAVIRGMTGVSARGFNRLSKRFLEGEYVNSAYESATGSRLELNISMGIGGITLESRPSKAS